MAIYELPARIDLPAYNYSIQLGDRTFGLAFKFNDRMDRWILSLSDEAGNLLVAGVPVEVNYPLFDQYKGPSLPNGTLYAFDTAGTNLDPGRYDLGARVKLLYEGYDG